MGSERKLSDEKRQMDDGLAAARLPVEPVRVGVAAEQRHLEEEHATGPDRGRSAEPRQDQLGDERLHLEEQKRAEQNGGGEEQRRDARATCKRRRR